jgi:ATP-dependent DNA ligase
MEAATADALPAGRDWQYEPKWDGFRCLAFRDGDTVRIQSKAGKPLGREPLQPELVVEVGYDHVTGERFRHGTRFLRWRPDKDPRQCRMSQLR